MDEIISKFLEAHVSHELNRFKREGYKKTIREEVNAVFGWIKKIKLKDVVTPEKIVGLIERNVVELPIAGGITELAGEMSQRVLASPQNKKTALEDIFARKQWDDIVDKVGSLKRARKEVIHRFVTSSVYSQQISEVLYTGIKEYLLAENFFAQKLPGVSSLIKLGRFAVNKTMHSLSTTVENTIKSYIESNLGNTIKRSEKSLNEYFDDAHIVEMGEEIRASIADRKLSEYFRSIDANDMEDFIVIGYEFWLHFRKTPYFKAIYTDLVHFFFEKYKDRELDVILEDVGVTRKMVINEITESVSPGIEKALSIGYIEERIRARLEDFYLSSTAAELVSQKKDVAKKRLPAKTALPKAVKQKQQTRK